MIADDPSSVEAAIAFLRSIGAPPHLQRHGKIVAEVATLLSLVLNKIGVAHDDKIVTVGAALHDAGKIVRPEELFGPGKLHEAAGEKLLLDNGISPKLARVCRTHGDWNADQTTFEERLIALADHLWKGSRSKRLEGIVIEHAATHLKIARWEAFLKLDPAFEQITSNAAERLVSANV